MKHFDFYGCYLHVVIQVSRCIPVLLDWTPNCTEVIVLALFLGSLTLVGANKSLVIDFSESK